MGTLYVVATPIGNLDDISPRSHAVLGAVTVIYAEDTRRTRKLLSHLGIRNRPLSLHGDSADVAWQQAAEALAAGDVAYVTDGGTPAVADPGRPPGPAGPRARPPGPDRARPVGGDGRAGGGGPGERRARFSSVFCRRAGRGACRRWNRRSRPTCRWWCSPPPRSARPAGRTRRSAGPRDRTGDLSRIDQAARTGGPHHPRQGPGAGGGEAGPRRKNAGAGPAAKAGRGPARIPAAGRNWRDCGNSGLSPSRAARELAARHRLPKDLIYRLVVDSDRS